MTFEENIILPSPLEAIRLSSEVVIQADELEPVARALFDVDIKWVPNNEQAAEFSRVLPELTRILEVTIQQPRSGELAAAVLTIGGSRKFASRLGMRKRTTSGTSSR